MKNVLFHIIIFFMSAGNSFGQQTCSVDGKTNTPLGSLEEWVCRDKGKDVSSVSEFKLDSTSILKSAYPTTFQTENKAKTLFVLQSASDPKMACPAHMYLIDLTGTKPRVFAFGVKNACAEYHWASWGKKRSVIAIKENIRFSYSNGKLNPPPADFGDGTPLLRRYTEDVKSQRNWPFVEELPIP